MAVGLCWACASIWTSSVASPIYGVSLPNGYRDWTLIAPAQEAAPLDELRAVVGNRKALKTYRAGARPFPDGTVLVKLAWKHTPSPDFPPASIPGAATTVQVMVKDSKRYRATGGWGFGRFVDGKPVDKAQHETCFACHAARVKDRDYVFIRYAP
ncbi:cytochrome C oxidase subunit III [Caulobacter sp. Root656]|nr:cytochrome C oxidase subunit III [Caulobacter sp. Root656]